MKTHSFQLFPIVKTNFLLISLLIVIGLVLFSLLVNNTFPPQVLGFVVLVIPLLMGRRKHHAELTNSSLQVISSQLKTAAFWELKELDVLGATKLDPNSDTIPKFIKPTFFSNSTDREYGFGKSENGQTVFQFVSRVDVPLVLIPLKAGGHILLSLQKSDLFLETLSSLTLESLESA